MLISRKWLNQYMGLGDITINELADKITAAGLEVEGIEYMAEGTNLVIGKILTAKPHPDSDHLQVCEVDVVDEVLQIVCGAPNCRAGLNVIVAKTGAKLPELEIKKGLIRGVESNGMICSLLELGVDGKNLSDEQKAGIEELAEDAPIGETKVLAYLGLDDEILDIGLTPNRNDCLAAFAMAKETGAVLNKEVTLPNYKGQSDGGLPTKLVVRSETEKCPLYTGKIIRNLTIKESPSWMRDLLMASGIKSINNVVDISNLVMLETGQPLHFFDLSKLEKEEIVVKDGMNCKYTALDGIEYQITEDDIMITIHDKPVAIGGVMGGDDSKIDDNTKGILIEAASFNHVAIRNTARRLNLNTDSSIHYQKGIEPKAPYIAMDRAVQLLVEYADADAIEETAFSADLTIDDVTFDVSLPRINHLLGTRFEENQVMDVLERLDFHPTKNGDFINVVIPSYRQDVKIEADIAEEIIRIIGFDDLESTMPMMSDTAGRLNRRQQLRRTLRSILCDQGFYEATSYTLVSEKMYKDSIMPLGSYEQLASPMSEDRKIIRGSILPSLLNCVAYNKARSLKNIPFFEISTVYGKDVMEERLAIVLQGALQENRWMKYEISPTFYMMKGMIQAILEKLGYNESRIIIKENTLDTTHFHPYRSAVVYIGKDLLGIFGVIHPNMAKAYEVSECVMAELNLEVILANKTSKVKYEAVSKYPQVVRDLAFVVEEDLAVSEITKAIKNCGKAIIKDVEVFDVYTGEHVEDGYKSIALSITFQANDRTLTDDEINQVHDKILSVLKDKLNAELRG
ncbi:MULTISPECIES: phenylalanine--tRNA ligase subunit beta [unclassified Breznakia]|uniref:phenylalanine--tRNA ligase subunit beta n=1 Tax=unclassified Breznakia TaxID=2623764 RepID=UPI002406FC4B|nr:MULTISPECIES: phenylalanine--tRNA ligase subunit beta [unclassified Breznakia]MDF9838490.1 phenylalanyl-tRNA synthetase beta chain [Breznakia sp. PFB2-8]MDF9859123.1 phenylalanyl-tRNA synthetase beta chain [Breznakia sp. PH5-24]